jgi:hypothetical protein
MITTRTLTRTLLTISAAALLVQLAGCSGKTRLEGTVTLNGDNVEDGTITLFVFSETGRSRANVSGPIKGGKYYLDSDKGLAPGSYKVEIHWMKKTGKQIPSNDPPNMIDETKEAVPKQYNTETTLLIEIKSGSNQKDFALTGQAKDEAPADKGGKRKDNN